MLRKIRYHMFALALLGVFTLVAGRNVNAVGGELVVVNTLPAARVLDADVNTPIGVLFDRPVDRTTIGADTFMAFGRWSGPVSGNIVYRQNDRAVGIVPDRPLSAGEQVMVLVAGTVRAADGSPIQPGGYAFQFWTAVRANPRPFDYLTTLDVRSEPGAGTRAYGGVATDFNGDGWLDISIVNETSADLRVFLNQADGSASFDPFLEPPTPVGNRASPSEPADFNRDGVADLAIANIDDDTVSVLIGNGDGTFQPQQVIPVGNAPRGIAVLDADGDGDMDIVNTNSAGAGSLSLLRNDGNGLFLPPLYMDTGYAGEWALAAADMNEDGRLDLVVGTQSFDQPSVIVVTANGDGTFTVTSAQASGGGMWMLNVGDVNGDGHEDVAVVKNYLSTGSILRGDGAGQLAPPQDIATGPRPIATDLGDLDGDGDLDWVVSNYLGDFEAYLNDGSGNYTPAGSYPATGAASCALIADLDNDGDTDLILIDEVDDVVILLEHRD